MPDALAENRDAYTRLDQALAAGGLGAGAHFLNGGYRPVPGEPDAAILPGRRRRQCRSGTPRRRTPRADAA